jgi:hypothetical protein
LLGQLADQEIILVVGCTNFVNEEQFNRINRWTLSPAAISLTPFENETCWSIVMEETPKNNVLCVQIVDETEFGFLTRVDCCVREEEFALANVLLMLSHNTC